MNDCGIKAESSLDMVLSMADQLTLIVNLNTIQYINKNIQYKSIKVQYINKNILNTKKALTIEITN